MPIVGTHRLHVERRVHLRLEETILCVSHAFLKHKTTRDRFVRPFISFPSDLSFASLLSHIAAFSGYRFTAVTVSDIEGLHQSRHASSTPTDSDRSISIPLASYPPSRSPSLAYLDRRSSADVPTCPTLAFPTFFHHLAQILSSSILSL